jgi:Zn-dependent protease with chaperone function
MGIATAEDDPEMNQLSSYVESETQVRVERWPTEVPLLVLVALSAAFLWLILALSVIGLIYALFIGLFFFISHLGFVAYLRGSALRLGPNQLPDLHARVLRLARRAGLSREPEVYVMQAGGALNALATGFLRSKMVVLYADLLEACGENEAARDMIIGHELGHIKAGHLTVPWLLFPGFLVPFLGMAYSRAREYTCDRYGAALCGDLPQGLVGLGILSAGGVHGRQVNLRALASQREHLNTGFMTIGKWLSTHPPLSERLIALEPRMVDTPVRGEIGVARALAGMALAGLVVIGLSALFVRALLPAFQEAMEAGQSLQAPSDKADPRDQVNYDLAMMVRLAMAYQKTSGSFPKDIQALRNAWELNHPRQAFPVDPYDGKPYGYVIKDDHAVIWSSGPDRRSGTDDDVAVDSRQVQF